MPWRDPAGGEAAAAAEWGREAARERKGVRRRGGSSSTRVCLFGFVGGGGGGGFEVKLKPSRGFRSAAAHLLLRRVGALQYSATASGPRWSS